MRYKDLFIKLFAMHRHDSIPSTKYKIKIYKSARQPQVVNFPDLESIQ